MEPPRSSRQHNPKRSNDEHRVRQKAQTVWGLKEPRKTHVCSARWGAESKSRARKSGTRNGFRKFGRQHRERVGAKVPYTRGSWLKIQVAECREHV